MKKAVVMSLAVVAGLLAVAALVSAISPSARADTPAGASSPAPSTTPTVTPTPADSPTPTPSATPTPPPPLRVRAVSPKRGARQVSPQSAITLRFSAALAPGTPRPTLSPGVPGHWTVVDSTKLVFRPTGHLPIYTTIRVTIRPGSAGVHALDGGRLASRYATSFTVRGPSSVLRLQQFLAELNYLPVRFTASGAGPVSALAREPQTPDLVSLLPVPGTFSWRYDHTPASLAALWKRGTSTVMLRGAVMAFEATHGLAADGVAGRRVWTAVLKAVAAHRAHKGGYDYIQVSTALPQTLAVWRSGRIIYRCRANTGIASRPTERGVFTVYARYLSTTMSGTNPDGTHYNDPGVPYVAYFNGGDAIHGFRRAAYGYPQSLGCVELSYSSAAFVFKYDPIGTLVRIH